MEKEKINYPLINEILEEYLEQYKNSPYVANLGFYGKKAQEVSRQFPLSEKEKQWANKMIEEAKEIPLLEGIDLVQQYLNHLEPKLAAEFSSQLEKGLIDITYLDEGSIEDDWYSERDEESKCCYNKIDQEFLILSNIAKKKNEFSMFATIVHEFFHSVNIKDIHNHGPGFCREVTAEFISIYFELDFLHWVAKEHNYSQEIFLVPYINRYLDTVYCSVHVNDETAMLLKKENNGLLDENSYKVNPVCKEEGYKKYMLYLSNRFEKYEQQQKTMAPYKKVFNQEKENEPLRTHIEARYIIGAPLAYYLANSNDPNMPWKMLDFNAEINTLSLDESFKKIGLTLDDIKKLDYGQIMTSFKEEIIEIAKNQKDYSTNKSVR